jgi:tRNA dimethylallyltransferase
LVLTAYHGKSGFVIDDFFLLLRSLLQIMNARKVLILGTTASGKGQLAFDLAEKLGGEIISIDSMKVYRRMDIGTAKPPKEARQRIKYHLIDIVEPSDSFSVAAFLDAAVGAIGQINSRNKPVIAVGGTALYIKALMFGLFEGPGTNEQIRSELRRRAEIEGLSGLYQELTEVDPVTAQKIHQNDAKRIIRALEVCRLTGEPISGFQKQWATPQTMDDERATSDERRTTKNDWTIIGLRREKTEESGRINARVKKMIADGFVDEVKSLLAEARPLSKQARCAIGYAEIMEHLAGRMTLEDAVELIKKNTRRLAKGQRTWFKTFKNVHWLDIQPEETPEKVLERTRAVLKNCQTLLNH